MIGKYGSFQANHVLGRPYHLTYELRDKGESTTQSGLRIVSAAELYEEIDEGEASSLGEVPDVRASTPQTGVEYEVVGENGEVVLRTNRGIIDDPNSQTMTMADIEKLKAQGTGSGKDLIAKILNSHVALDQKTAYALAKYTLRKTKKFLRRFTVLPLEVPLMTRWMLNNKDPMKTMELREETLAMIGSLSNIHCTPDKPLEQFDSGVTEVGTGRWLVVDETGGLLVANMAEHMGILHAADPESIASEQELQDGTTETNGTIHDGLSDQDQSGLAQRPKSIYRSSQMANTNIITLIHANSQPNLALLKYFGFDDGNPQPSHPLYQHLRTLSWLQLLAPQDDLGYMEPEAFPNEVIQTWKSGRKSNYYRKRRRWERIRTVVEETRNGGFDGLIIASVMDYTTILRHTIPLLRGAAQVVIYSPTIEPLVELTDLYSSGRRSAFVTDPPGPDSMPTEDFPLDPTLLLATTIQTVRCRNWQVLPGRTHPLMTGRGGSEGYIFSATRVLPAQGKIEARGKFKRRKINDGDSARASEARERSPATPETTLDPVQTST